jgi:uncharacterized protein YjdB
MEKTGLIVAIVLPSDATNKNVTWQSSNTAVATVDNMGLVTGKSAGLASITCTTEDGDFTATCEVAVNATLITVITLNVTERVMEKGAQFQLIPTVIPDNASVPALNWSSSQTGVATVSNTGLVTAIAPGESVITVAATDGSAVTTTASITVIISVTGVTVQPTSMTLTF